MLALEHRAIPLRLSGNQVVTAFAEPPEPDDVAALTGILGHEIVPVLANPMMVDRMVQPAEAHVGNGEWPQTSGRSWGRDLGPGGV